MIRGVLLPIITPFDEKVRVDEQMMRAAGRFSHQSRRARSIRARIHRARAGDDDRRTKTDGGDCAGSGQVARPVVIHVGTADAGSAVELAEHAAAHKADAVAIVPPYYYSDHTEFEIIAHYKAVAKAVPLPIFIYENPKYSGISIPPGFAVRMKEQVPTLKGIKVAYGQGALLEYVRLLPDVSVFTGNADLFGLVPFGVAGHDQSADEFCSRALRRDFRRLGSPGLSARGGSAEERRYCGAAGGRAPEEIRPRPAAGSFSHARFCGQEISEMGNRADAQR